jgi:hypothetical protein
MHRLLLALAFATLMRADVVDKLAITVEHNVITELTIDEDIRVVALINGQPIDRSLEARRAAADRLVQRLLIQHEMSISRYPLPTEQEVSIYLSQVEAAIGAGDRFTQLLSEYDVTKTTLVDYLTAQLTMLRFIEYRFSPDVTVSEADIEAAFRADSPTGLLTEAKRASISQRLSAERTDAALESWLAESRKQLNIVYLDTALQ